MVQSPSNFVFQEVDAIVILGKNSGNVLPAICYEEGAYRNEQQ